MAIFSALFTQRSGTIFRDMSHEAATRALYSAVLAYVAFLPALVAVGGAGGVSVVLLAHATCQFYFCPAIFSYMSLLPTFVAVCLAQWFRVVLFAHVAYFWVCGAIFYCVV